MKALNISISGTIGKSMFDDGFTAKDFRSKLESEPKAKEVNIIINSDGGSVFDGFEIHNMIKAAQAKGVVFTAIIESRAASIATYIAIGCDKIKAYPNAKWLVHYPTNGMEGTASEMEQNASVLRSMERDLISAYCNKTGMTENETRVLLEKDTFITAAEAFSLKFIDEIIGDYKAIATFTTKTNTDMSEVSEAIATGFKDLLKSFKANKEATNMVVIEGEVKKGSKATIDGAAAPDGDYTLPDGMKITVKGGVVDVILSEPADAELEAVKTKLADAEAKVTASATEVETLKASIAASEAKFKDVETKFNALVDNIKKETSTGEIKNIFAGVQGFTNKKEVKEEGADKASAFLNSLGFTDKF